MLNLSTIENTFLKMAALLLLDWTSIVLTLYYNLLDWTSIFFNFVLKHWIGL